MKAVIIGGGIVGLCTAYYLNQSGWEVTIADQGDFTNNCSFGNLGMVVPSHFVPLAMPGMVSQGIRWMFDRKSPFYVRPSLNPKLIDWGLKFIKSATQKNTEQAAEPLRDINLLSRQLYEELSTQPEFDFAFEKKGIIMYYKTPKAGEEENHLAEKARSMGLDAVSLNHQELHLLEPDAKPDVLGGVHYRCDAHLSPHLLMEQLVNLLKEKGVEFLPNQNIININRSGNKIESVSTATDNFKGDLFVLAAGSWLPTLTKKAGLRLPLMPGKGYSFNHSNPQVKINIPAILCEARVAITPMNNSLRIGGTMEIGAINNNIQMNRVEGIVQSIPAYFPSLKMQLPAKNEVWYGFRPCSPDGLPYVGRPNNISNLLIGGGHAMMGLSLGPATGKLLAQLANHQTTSINIEAFSVDRF